MAHPPFLNDHAEDLAEDLARTLPRWVSWVPIVGRASYRSWTRFRARRQPENWLTIDLLSSRIDLHVRDEGSIQLEFLATNFGTRDLDIERVEVFSLQVGVRNLRRRGEMFAMSYSIPARGSVRTTLQVDLLGGDLRQVAQGVGKAVNAWTSPQVSVSLYSCVHCLDRHHRFRKLVQSSTNIVSCNMSEAAVASLLNSDGLTA